MQFDGNITEVALEDLVPFTRYVFKIEACTVAGCTESADSRAVETLKARKYKQQEGIPAGCVLPAWKPYVSVAITRCCSWGGHHLTFPGGGGVGILVSSDGQQMSLAGVGTCEVQCILGDVTWGLPYTMNIQMSVETLPPRNFVCGP